MIYGKRYILTSLAAAGVMACGTVYGFSPERYATSSRLAKGQWAKIRVDETGMQLITAAQLRNLGFSDPSKVHVYGYGGRMISETLDETHPDDLPLLPSVHTSKGVVFYGVNRTSWSATVGDAMYARTQNPYSLNSYYFISDAAVEEVPMSVMMQGTAIGEPVSTFTARLIHENEIQAPFQSGRRVYGEDFRAQTSQTFPFTLRGVTGENVVVTTVFGTNTGNAPTTFTVTANGKQSQKGSTVQIAATTSNIMFREGRSCAIFPVEGEKLNVGVKYTPSGAVSMARLDYITVEYERSLNMNGDADLYFYDIASEGKSYRISGCTSSTEIWDVTTPGSPMRVEAVRNGDSMTFTAPGSGYREFVAFDAERVSRGVTPSGKVSTQNIHGMDTPDMLIISPQQYMTQSRRIAAIHEQVDGWRVHVLTPEEIYNEFSSGTPDAGAFRKVLKMWYDRGESDGHRLSHCLIVSRPTYDNLGVSQGVKGLSYPRVPMWQDYDEQYNNKEYSYGMDDYIAMLEDGATTATKAGRDNNVISIAVGRMPVKSVSELTAMVDKLESYLLTPEYGSWRNKGVLLADDEEAGEHMEQADALYKGLHAAAPEFDYDRIYTDTYSRESSGRGYSYPVAKEQLMRSLNDGVATWTYVGHGSTTGLTAEDMFNWDDINGLTNRHPFIMYAATCEFLRWDDDNVSGAEILWLYPNAGAIAMMIATRSVLILQNGYLTESMGEHWFSRDADGRGLTIGELLRRGKNTSRTKRSAGSNSLRYVVMGDPAIRIPMPVYRTVVDEINGIPVGKGLEMPEFGATDRLTVKGHVEDMSGALATDFTGEMEIILQDAERVVSGLGNGGDDVSAEKAYNMRTSMLNKVREKITDGVWETTIIVPPLIDNNYSPARLGMYAFDGKGQEANGSCEDFYLYGQGSGNHSDDTTGPEIELLALNSESFSPNDIVNESPLVMARVRDEAGINVYGGIIGHQLIVTVDDNKYTNVADYYTPALADASAGNILFPLDNLDPGDHTLALTVYDMAGNFSERSVPFRVAVGRAPNITDVTTDVNPASTGVKFLLSHDRPSEVLDCTIDVFDLSGRKVWSTNTSTGSSLTADVQVSWNLCDGTGARVPRGIYLYRATVTTAEGVSTSKTRKLAVTAR